MFVIFKIQNLERERERSNKSSLQLYKFIETQARLLYDSFDEKMDKKDLDCSVERADVSFTRLFSLLDEFYSLSIAPSCDRYNVYELNTRWSYISFTINFNS